jgi:hypothetical protein
MVLNDDDIWEQTPINAGGKFIFFRKGPDNRVIK